MLATLVQVLGLITISAGIGWIFPPAGVVALGVGIILFGIAMERGK